jgi:hypothetical protein
VVERAATTSAGGVAPAGLLIDRPDLGSYTGWVFTSCRLTVARAATIFGDHSYRSDLYE